MGTAGHVDHGKTALIRLLTGIDTDRLKEERERGISIELGFAHFELSNGVRLGIVDVPGHERFVRHMLAGAGGIDFVLLVVAADEGVMPQTVEHAQILELLGVDRGIVVLTKVDLVDAEMVELAAADVAETLADTPFADWPVVQVSAATGAGRESLLEALDSIVAEVPGRQTAGQPRLPVDRVFTVDGVGTVVTGTLWEGAVEEGDRAWVAPRRLPVRVRQVQMHGQRAKRASAGSRVALALHGVAREDVERGDWVVAEGSLAPRSIVDVRLRMVASGERAMKQRERVRFHLGASEVFGRVVLFGGDRLEPGDEGFAQLRLESPVVARRGDRFVLRWYSPVRTAAGGHVIDPSAPKRKRSEADAVAVLELADSGSVTERLLAYAQSHSCQALVAGEIEELGVEATAVERTLAELTEGGDLVALPGGAFALAEVWEVLRGRIHAAADEYQRRYPLRFGVKQSELRSRLRDVAEAALIDAAIAAEVNQGEVFVREDRLRVGSAEPELPAPMVEQAQSLCGALEAGGLAVPAPASLREGLDLPESSFAELVAYLVAKGSLVRLAPDLCYTGRQLEELEAWVLRHFASHPELSVTHFKEEHQLSRKYTVPLLEYLDKRGITRRAGDTRVPGRRAADASRSHT